MTTQRNRYIRRALKAKRKHFQSGHRTSPSSYSAERYNWRLAWGVWSPNYSKAWRKQMDKILRLAKSTKRNRRTLIDW